MVSNKIIPIILIGMLLSACIHNQEDVNPNYKQPIEWSISPDFTPEEHDKILQALSEWNSYLKNYQFTSNDKSSQKIIKTTSDKIEGRLGWLHKNDLGYCQIDLASDTKMDFKTRVLHELGHYIASSNDHITESFGHIMTNPPTANFITDGDLNYCSLKITEKK